MIIEIEDKPEQYVKGFKECLLESIYLMEHHPDEPVETFVKAFKRAVCMLEKKSD